MKSIKFKVVAGISAATIALSSCSGVEETASSEPKVFSVEQVLTMVAKENAIARTTYTKRIVGGLKTQGLKFHEDWEDDDVEAGPLPALFLRGASNYISRKSNVPLGLYLGSDSPINASNKFEGKQAELFEKIKSDQKPQFFKETKEDGSTINTAMFADVAKAQPCVTCHNEHPNTAKSDWKLGDVMGATTWQYPEDSLTYTEAMDVLKAYRDGVADIYNQMITEIEGFKESPKPSIGSQWPSEGYYLPTAEVFLDSVRKMTSYETMKALMM